MNKQSPDDMKNINKATREVKKKEYSIWLKLLASMVIVWLMLIAVAVVIWLIILTKWWLITVWLFCLAVYIVYQHMDDY